MPSLKSAILVPLKNSQRFVNESLKLIEEWSYFLSIFENSTYDIHIILQKNSYLTEISHIWALQPPFSNILKQICIEVKVH